MQGLQALISDLLSNGLLRDESSTAESSQTRKTSFEEKRDSLFRQKIIGHGYQYNGNFFGTSTYDYQYNEDLFKTSTYGTTVPLLKNLNQESNMQRFSLSYERMKDLNLGNSESPLRTFAPVDNTCSPNERIIGIYHQFSGGDRFRLLEILPGDGDAIQCRLHVCSLKENVMAYEALSYTWGISEASNDHKIEVMVNDKSNSLAITVSLYVALRDLRRRNAPRLIWVDAICINQKDFTERGQQVRLMGEIFSGAWQVVIWLGEEADFCSCGHTIIESSLSSISNAFSGLCTTVNSWLVQTGHGGIKATYYKISSDGQYILHHRPIDKCEMDTQIQSLFRRRWFNRIWVLQEAALARRAVVQLGSYQIPWEWLGLAAAIIAHKPKLTDDGLGREMVPIGTMHAYLMYRLSVSQNCFPPLKFSLAQLLQVTRLFECKEPKDKIYGLLGIQTTDSVIKRIVPDYCKQTSTEQVYEDVARLMLESDSPLTFLSGAGTFGDFQHSGSSWVPSWHKQRPWTILPTKKHPQFQCGLGRPIKIDWTGETSQLLLQGVLLDRTQVIQNSRGSWWLFKEEEMAHDSFLSKSRWSVADWKKCALTLTCGSDGRAYPVDDEDTHLADFAATVLSGKPAWVLRDLTALENTIESKPGDVTQREYLADIAKTGNSRRYICAAAPVLDSYRLFTTESNLFGVGPVNMKIGDRLCVLFGAEVPLLLRPTGDGYVVVGECYVHDVMHGEVFDKLEEGSVKASWIKLV